MRRCMKKKGLLLLVAIAATIISTSNVSAETTVSGNITTDTTWALSGSPYIVSGSVTVQGTDGDDGITTLTIEPGVEVRFNAYTGLTIGASSGNPGALSAIGTSENRITFTSNKATPGAGDWYGVYFYNTTDDQSTTMAYCDINYCGYSYGSLYVVSASPLINHCTISNSNTNGIYVYSGSPKLTGNTIRNNNLCGVYNRSVACRPEITNSVISENGSYPIRIGATMKISGNTYSANGIQAIEVLGETINTDITYENIGIPYVITGSITVQGIDGDDGVTTMTIKPGAALRFNAYTGLTIGGYSGNPGALSAIGTSDNRITFTSNKATPAAGDWNSIYFYDTTDDQSTTMAYCDVEYGGYNYGSLYVVSASPSIDNCIISNSKTYGIYLSGAGADNTNIECNTIKNNQNGIYTSNCSKMTILNNNIVNNTTYAVYHSSGLELTVASNWWGSSNGPGETGSVIYGNVITEPFLTSEKDCDALQPPGDSDNDGLDDAWEMENFGHLNNGAQDDTDGDGYSNLQEYILNTDPTIPTSGKFFEYDDAGRIRKIISTME